MIRALVLGGAGCLWRDIEAAMRLGKFTCTIACNAAIHDYPGEIDHAVSFHSDLLPYWAEKRRARGFANPKAYWTVAGHHAPDGMATRFVPPWGGSSGMVGAQVALAIGASHIVLAGIPLDPEEEHFDKAGRWDEAYRHRAAWERHAKDFGYRLRSMSGWTAELFGRPSRGWLQV